MVYYDVRTNEWTKELDTNWLAPELYYEIHESPDDKQYHTFMTKDGLVSFSSTDNDDFQKQYEEIKDKVIYRKSWSVPKEVYHGGLKYFNLED